MVQSTDIVKHEAESSGVKYLVVIITIVFIYLFFLILNFKFV